MNKIPETYLRYSAEALTSPIGFTSTLTFFTASSINSSFIFLFFKNLSTLINLRGVGAIEPIAIRTSAILSFSTSKIRATVAREIAIACLKPNLIKYPFLFIELSLIFILVIISSSCKTVFLGPTKKSFKEISLFSSILSTSKTASKTNKGGAISAAGEASAKFPPMVALFLIIGSANCSAV